jgi:hypothetical protein
VFRPAGSQAAVAKVAATLQSKEIVCGISARASSVWLAFPRRQTPRLSTRD